MLKKTCTLMALAALGSMVFATIDLRTSIRDIYYRGTCEEAGTIAFKVTGDDFFEASTENPVFIRILLGKGATLCETLVGRSDANGPDDAIYLAMRYDGTNPGAFAVVAPPETTSIVRWIRNENQFWLRIQYTSNAWLQDFGLGGIGPPRPTDTVRFTVGQTARATYAENNAPYSDGRANLPCNTTEVDHITAGDAPLTAWAVSTLICVNVSNSILVEFPFDGSELEFDPITWDSQSAPSVYTAGSANGIFLGNQTGVGFSNDRIIARGFDKNCSMQAIGKYAPGYAPLCLQEGGTNEGDVDTVYINNTLTMRVNCDYGLQGNSYLTVNTANGASYGFPLLISGGNPVLYGDDDEYYLVTGWDATATADGAGGTWTAYTPIEDVFTDACGNLLTDTVIIYYDTDLGEDSNDQVYDIYLSGTVCMCYSYDPTDVNLSVTARFSNRGNIYDSSPFDGVDDDVYEDVISAYMQRRFCPASTITVGPVDWFFGTFGPCVGAPVVIFYPYLPKLYNTAFWTGISYVNHGGNDFEAGEIVARIYEADGSLWTASLPALPTKNQHTWLLQETDAGVGFVDPDGFEDFVPLVAGGSDLVPLDRKSSMFIIGTLVGQTVGEISGGDLDGFCLIGNQDTNVVYGYTVRNVQPGAGHIGDLPIVQFKK